MTARLVLDTTVLIDALRGYPAADRIRSLRRSNTRLWTTPISIEELWRGIRPDEHDRTRTLLSALRLAPIDREAAMLAGEWRRENAGRGVTLHQADCLIAAATYRIGATLATGNPADFPMPEVEVEHWPVGR